MACMLKEGGNGSGGNIVEKGNCAAGQARDQEDGYGHLCKWSGRVEERDAKQARSPPRSINFSRQEGVHGATSFFTRLAGASLHVLVCCDPTRI